MAVLPQFVSSPGLPGVQQWWTTLGQWGEQLAYEASYADITASEALYVADAGGVGVLAGLGLSIGLPEIIIGVLGLAIFIGIGDLIFKPIGDICYRLPVVGPALRDVFYSAQSTCQTVTNAVCQFAFGGLIQVATDIFRLMYGTFRSITHTISITAGALIWVSRTQIPQAIGEAEAFAQAGATFAYDHATQVGADAIAFAQAGATYAYDHATQVGVEAEAFAQAGATFAYDHATQVFQQAEAEIQALPQQWRQDIGDAVNGVELTLGNAITQAEAQAKADLGFAVQGLGLDIAAGVGAATAVATATQGQLQKYLDNCGTAVCAAQGQNSKNVNELGSLGQMAALLAFLFEAVEHPVETANVTYDALSPIIGIGGGALDALIGAVV